ncbi:MAG: extracellular solute-binding protein [Clostridiaceae bacterium]|nr:extracellular solute-binding protein [Clostridiaceae bacterium]
MKKARRCILPVLIVLLSLMVIATGCVVKEIGSGQGQETSQTSKQATTSQTQPKVEPPVKLKMFFGDAGIAFPSDVDKSDNPFLNIIEKAANVDLEMIQPVYADFQTKFNLMMASGEIPDIVHCWFHSDIDKYGAEGAFLDWEPLVQKSAILSKIYNKDMLDMSRTSDGKVYKLYTLGNDNPNGTYARLDLIQEVWGDKMPITPNDWYDVMKKVKEKYPDSVPLSSGGGFMMMDMFFKAFGAQVDGNGVKLQTTDDNKYIWAFEYPKMKDAILFHRKLYEEGLLDKTFITNTSAEFTNRINEKNAMIWRGDSAAVLGRQQEFAKLGNTNAIVGFVNNPIAEGVDPKLAYWAFSPLGWHIVSISSKSQNPDAAVRVIETLLDYDICKQISWGREGIEYYVRPDGTRLVDTEASSKTYYRNAYTFMRQYWYQEGMDVRMATVLPTLDATQASKFREAWQKGIEIRNKESAMVPIITPASFIPTIAELAPKMDEAREESKVIMYKAVMGEISMEEYDIQVNAWLQKYKYIADEYTKELQEVIQERGDEKIYKTN